MSPGEPDVWRVILLEATASPDLLIIRDQRVAWEQQQSETHYIVLDFVLCALPVVLTQADLLYLFSLDITIDIARNPK